MFNYCTPLHGPVRIRVPETALMEEFAHTTLATYFESLQYRRDFRVVIICFKKSVLIFRVLNECSYFVGFEVLRWEPGEGSVYLAQTT